MFNWLTKCAESVFYGGVIFATNEIKVGFTFFNLEFTSYIPLPIHIGRFDMGYTREYLSPFCRKYKNSSEDSIKKRWWEFQLMYDGNLQTGFWISIPYEQQDHDHRTYSISILGWTLCLTSYHAWHLCVYDCEDKYIERFPTDEEIIAYNKYCNDLYKEMFGDKKANCKENYEELQSYWKKVEEYYNNIPANDVIGDDDI